MMFEQSHKPLHVEMMRIVSYAMASVGSKNCEYHLCILMIVEQSHKPRQVESSCRHCNQSTIVVTIVANTL